VRSGPLACSSAQTALLKMNNPARLVNIRIRMDLLIFLPSILKAISLDRPGQILEIFVTSGQGYFKHILTT
jgi:hypothetical protein